MALVWFFYEGIRRGWVKPKNESWERDTVSKLLKVIIILGVVLGVVLIITAVMTMIMDIPPSYSYRDQPGALSRGPHFDYLVSISLLVMGLAMFIKPLEDVPLATIIGLACGAGAAFLLAMLIPKDIVSDQTLKWVLIIVFIVITSLIGAMIRVWIAGIEGVAKFISWPPIALVAAAFCLVEGFSVLLAGKTLFLIGG
ncbi:MAG: hypothetical protein ACTSVU_08190 [Promethearchaeota archaeon]